MKSQGIEPGRALSIDTNKLAQTMKDIDDSPEKKGTIDSKSTFERKTTLDYARTNKRASLNMGRRESGGPM